MFSDASSFDSRPDERLAGCWLSLNMTDDWIALHFMVALATHRTGSIWWMRAQTCFHRHPVKTFLELSATICSQSRVANQQIINNGSCAECWPRLFETSARSRKMVMAWRYTHTRVEPHSNMTRLEQCDGVGYGHDPTTLTPSAYWFGLRNRNDVTGFLLFQFLLASFSSKSHHHAGETESLFVDHHSYCLLCPPATGRRRVDFSVASI